MIMTISGRPGVDPQVHRRRLGARLKRIREEAHLTQQQVTKALEWSLSKLVRIEMGAVGISATDLRALLQQYGVTDEQQLRPLLDDARAGRPTTWWRHFGDLPPQFISYLAYESSATLIRQYQGLVIPGLLQTEPYARAVLGAVSEPERISTLVELRRKRQELLDRSDEPRLFFILDEAAIRRRVGGLDVMLAQLRHLKELGRRSNITIQILPFEVGQHAGLNGPFVVLDVGDDYPVVYLENSGGDVLSRDDPDEASRYTSSFRQLEAVATAENKLNDFIDGVIAEMKTRAASVDSADTA
jgi:transcriptional regulator with XRE-family HTH domain